MRLSEKCGIVANVDFLHLERTLWDRLGELDLYRQAVERKPARLLDEKNLQLFILAILRNRPPEAAGAYLEAGQGDSLQARRLFQLSAKLADFFREYEYSRVPDGTRKGLAWLWKHGEDCFRGYLRKDAPKAVRAQVEGLERWQKAIYHELFREGGIRDQVGLQTGQYLYTLPQYAEMVLAQARTAAPPGTEPPAYHLFGLSQISPFHRSLIRRLADAKALQGRHARFHIYSLNPCAEYWEDALDRRERRRVQQEDLLRRRKYVDWHQLTSDERKRLNRQMEDLQEEELHLEEENPLLGQWGRPGRETLHLWNSEPDIEYDFYSHYREPESKGLLGAVQNALLKRRGMLEADERAQQDASLRILACPEIHREVETARDCIIEDLLADPTLRPDEIAILAPDMSKYRHVLASVFGRTAEGDPGHVPYGFGDGSASAESDFARGVRALFELARGRFSRKELFALAANPCFRSGLGLDEESLKVWSDWADRLNIHHGFDGADRKARGYPEDETHTWGLGLERLLLGTIMEAPKQADGRHFAGLVPYADGRSGDRELLRPFLTVIERLHASLAPFRDGERRSWSQWAERFDALWQEYLTVPRDETLEAFVQANLRRYLLEMRGLDGMDALLGASGGVSADLPVNLVLGHLEGLKAGRDGNFTGGVNISGLHALRSLPFRVIHVLGLGEGEFPEDPASSTLDLRQYKRVPGDVDPAARNRYLFLETLVCAADKLRLSYVCRDVQQGKAFQMSSVLNELVDHLQHGILPREAGKPAIFRQAQVPLLAREPALTAAGPRTAWDPPRNPDRQERLLGWMEAKGKALAPALRGPDAAQDGVLPYVRGHLPAALRHEIFPAPPSATAPAAAKPVGPIAVQLEDLRRYLSNPVESTLRAHLGIREHRENKDPLAEEPFSCPRDCDRDLLERVVRERLSHWREPSPERTEHAFLELYEDFARRGRMPSGHYRTLDRERQWAKAGTALETVGALLSAYAEEGEPDLKLDVRLGDGDRHRTAEGPSFPPVRLRTPVGREVELHGQLSNLILLPHGQGAASLILNRAEKRISRLLTPFLFYQAGLLAEGELSGWLGRGKFNARSLYNANDKYAVWNWAPFSITPAAARAYLGSLADAFLAGPDFDLLPFDAIVACLMEGPQLYRLKADPDYAGLLREELDESEGKGEWAAWKAPETVRILDPRVPDDAFDKVQRRLGPFFNWVPG
jgi:exodeoxyribonuclease V gamma subunit